MPKAPSGRKRPADVIGNAVRVMQIATGQAEEVPDDSARIKASKAGGLKGGKARAAALSPERRKEIARKGAAKRWSKEQKRDEEKS